MQDFIHQEHSLKKDLTRANVWHYYSNLFCFGSCSDQQVAPPWKLTVFPRELMVGRWNVLLKWSLFLRGHVSFHRVISMDGSCVMWDDWCVFSGQIKIHYPKGNYTIRTCRIDQLLVSCCWCNASLDQTGPLYHAATRVLLAPSVVSRFQASWKNGPFPRLVVRKWEVSDLFNQQPLDTKTLNHECFKP